MLRKALVNLCTSLNLVLGLAAILLSSSGHIRAAAFCLLGCIVMDAADGYLARLLSVSSEFGAQLDSLADMTSFNVGGAVLCFFWFGPSPAVAAMSGLYVVMGAGRLARFNASPKLSDEFQGMPTTAMATLVAMGYLAWPHLAPDLGVPLCALCALLMMSVFPYPKFTRIARFPRWFWLVLLAAGVVGFAWTVGVCSVFYVLSGPLIGLVRLFRPPAALSA